MLFLAKLIPRILHNVNRICYVFGEPVQYQITDITHTTLNNYVIKQLRQADAIANEVSFIGIENYALFTLRFKGIFITIIINNRILLTTKSFPIDIKTYGRMSAPSYFSDITTLT